MIYCVFKCDFDGFKIAVNKGVTLQRFPAKGHLRRAGDVVLVLPPYCYYIASSVLLILKKGSDYNVEADNVLRIFRVSVVLNNCQ